MIAINIRSTPDWSNGTCLCPMIQIVIFKNCSYLIGLHAGKKKLLIKLYKNVKMKIRWMYFWRCPWCNGNRRRKWTGRHESKSWTDCISHSTNTLGKGMNPIILPPTMGKIVRQTRFFSLGEATSLGEGKLWIQTC